MWIVYLYTARRLVSFKLPSGSTSILWRRFFKIKFCEINVRLLNLEIFILQFFRLVVFAVKVVWRQRSYPKVLCYLIDSFPLIYNINFKDEYLVVIQWCFFIYFFVLYSTFLPYSMLSFSKLDQGGTLKRSFSDFLNIYLMTREKPPTNFKKPLK